MHEYSHTNRWDIDIELQCLGAEHWTQNNGSWYKCGNIYGELWRKMDCNIWLLLLRISQFAWVILRLGLTSNVYVKGCWDRIPCDNSSCFFSILMSAPAHHSTQTLIGNILYYGGASARCRATCCCFFVGRDLCCPAQCAVPLRHWAP